MPFSSGIPIFSRIHVLVFRSVQLILSIRCHTHISKAVTSFSSHFFSTRLSDPYNAVLHISDRVVNGWRFFTEPQSAISSRATCTRHSTDLLSSLILRLFPHQCLLFSVERRHFLRSPSLSATHTSHTYVSSLLNNFWCLWHGQAPSRGLESLKLGGLARYQ